MNTGKFVKYLLGVTVITLIVLAALNLVLPITPFLDFVIITLVLFILFTVLVFFLGQKTSKGKSGNLFLYIIMINIFFKLLGSFALVFLYVELKSPESKMFIIPFLIIYFVFTIFETYFLSLQAQESK